MTQITCPFCQQFCDTYHQILNRADCDRHPGVIIRFCRDSELFIDSTWFIIDYNNKVYAIKCRGPNCRIEEWENFDSIFPGRKGFRYVKTVIRLNQVPDNLSPENAFNKLKTILLFS